MMLRRVKETVFASETMNVKEMEIKLQHCRGRHPETLFYHVASSFTSFAFSCNVLINLTAWWTDRWSWAQVTHRQRVFSNLTAGQSHEVWRVEPLIHGRPLTGVNYEEQLVVPGRTHTHTESCAKQAWQWHIACPFVPIKPDITKTFQPSFIPQLPWWQLHSVPSNTPTHRVPAPAE